MMEEERILHSWKEISSYLNQDTRTCQRWEAEFGLPVRRISNHSFRSNVFAYKSELDQWLQEKTKNHILRKKAFFERREVYLGLISFLAFIAAFFAFLYFTHQKPISPPFKSLSIAVYPFEVVNPTESDDYISEGLTSQIVNYLTRLEHLQVIPVPAASTSNSQSLELVKRDINADYLLIAKIEKNETKIKICARLTRRKDARNIMDEVFEDRLGNLYSVQENLCLKVLEKLNLLDSMNPSLLSGDGKPLDYKAFDSLLVGNYILNKTKDGNDTPWKLCYKGKYYWNLSTRDSNALAIKFFTEAVEIDNNYADAYIGLAHCYANNVNFKWDFNIYWLNKAEEMLQKAHGINPDLPDYYSTLIEVYLLKDIVFNEDTKALAFQLAQEGIERYPNHALINSIAGYCYLRKFGEDGDEADFEKALEFKEKSFWLNTFASHNFLCATLLMLDQKFDMALQYNDVAKKYAPPLMADYVFGEIFYYKGDLDKSRAIFLQMDMPTEYKISSLLYLGMIAAQKGDKGEVRRIIQAVNNLSPGENFIFEEPLKLASIYMGTGEKELGYKYLKPFFGEERARKMHHIYRKLIEIDKNFDRVRDEEEFKKIVMKESRNILQASSSQR
jgi:TolB-like protein/TPR repeat protein